MLKNLAEQILMALAEQNVKKSAWDTIEEQLRKPSVLDRIIKEILEESNKQKEEKKRISREQQRAYERQRAERVKKTKKQYGLLREEEEKKEEEEEKKVEVNRNNSRQKDYPRLPSFP